MWTSRRTPTWPRSRRVLTYAYWPADSLSTAEAAIRLGISDSRVRRRAAARQIYGMRARGA